MKKIYKRFISALLAAAVAVSAAACGQEQKGDVNDGSSESVSESVSGETSDEVSETSEPASTPIPTAASTPTPTPEAVYLENLDSLNAGSLIPEDQIDFGDLGRYFTSFEISDELFARIYGDDKSYKTYCTVPREDLRYIKLLHYGFDGNVHVGELMVNTLLADEVCEIFRILFENKYQIEKMYLIDNYNADDMASIADNNTSAFNYRLVTGGDYLSNHAGGCAIDINPINNPYVWYENGELTWEDPDAALYLDRNAADAYERHMINHDDLCYKLFAERGWGWGGDWENPIDYQHFEKVVATY